MPSTSLTHAAEQRDPTRKETRMPTTTPKTCRKVPDVLIDAKVVIEPTYNSIYSGWQSEDKKAELLEQWARELHAFFRDHRSQDVNTVYVERTHQDQCSVCHREWETYEDEDTGETCCAGCGAIVEPAK